MDNLELTPLEQRILDASADLDVTRKRRAYVVLFGLVFMAALIAVSLSGRSWSFVLGISLAYIALTVCEKVAYANAVIAYKGLIQKLKKRVDELESGAESRT